MKQTYSLMIHNLLIVVLCCLVLSGCALLSKKDGPAERRYAVYPLVNCDETMNDKTFWLNKYLFPDKMLLTKTEIKKLNQATYKRGLLTDVFSSQLWDYKYIEVDRPEEVNPDGEWNIKQPMLFSSGVLKGYTLYTYLKDETVRLKRYNRWVANGQPVTKVFFQELDDNLDLNALKENNPLCYGLTKRRTDIRYYPTDELITGRRWDTNFDIIQVSSIRALQPLVILHKSKDNKWLFVVSPYCRGWIKANDVVAYCDPQAIKRFLKSPRKLVVTGHAVEAVVAKGSTQIAEVLYMGSTFPLLGRTSHYYKIALPELGKRGQLNVRAAYISRQADVSDGYLKCTTRNIINQVFKLLHTPYSWGGKGQHRDCSQLIMDVYATMGIIMPRNSSVQGRVGSSRYSFNKSDSLERKMLELKNLDRPVLLQFPGHIMLYLGRHGEYYYAIHDIWAYRVFNKPGKDDRVIIGQAVVSDMSLGQGSNKGSLMERLTTINLLRP